MERPAAAESRQFEHRSFAFSLEKRDDAPAGRLVGHAAVFNSLSEDLGGFRELIAPGAFASSIAKDDVRALFNHDPNFVLGRTSSGTLRLAEDMRGLAIEVDMPDTQTIRDLVTAPVQRGDVSQMSFAFETVTDEWRKDTAGDWTRTLVEVRLYDVSPVTFPAYPATDVSARSKEVFERLARGESVRDAHFAHLRRRLDLVERV